MDQIKTGSPLEKLKLVAALIVVVLCSAGYQFVSKIALNIGVTKLVFLVYRNLSALLFLGPLAYFLEKKERPPLTFSLLVQFFLLGLIGITANQGLYILAMYYASPTIASLMQNTTPAFTFVMASILRLEEMHFMRRDGIAKIIGTIASIGGATIITLYRGPPLLGGTNFLDSPNEKMLNRTLGCVLFAGNCLSYASWMVLQAPVVKNYPAKLSFTSFTCFFGLIQLLLVAVFTEKDSEHWRIQSRNEVFVILYAGIVFSGISYYLTSWCIQKGGSVFTATAQPMQTIVVAVMAFVFLGDQLYSGVVLGGILIVIGLYLVLWGKTEEGKIARNKDNEAMALREHLIES